MLLLGVLVVKANVLLIAYGFLKYVYLLKV